MSKMNDIALQLDERAVELGFADHLEALGNGYEWGIKDNGEAFLFNLKEEQEKAHEAWLEEKNSLLKDLTRLQEILETLADGEKHEISSYWADTIWHAISFIERGEM